MRTLADNMDSLAEMLNFLQQETTISQRDRHKIREAGIREEQIECLVSCLMRKADSAFSDFVRALKHTNQAHMATLLQEPGELGKCETLGGKQ